MTTPGRYARGPKGDAGVAGAQGPKGDTGATGAAGPKGDTGSAGAQGAPGADGSAGATGPKGDTGNTGAQGPKGDKGDTGDPGPAGAGGGNVTGASASADGEVALFSGTGGKDIKRATGSGLAKLNSGVLSTATEGTDYYKPTGTDVAVTDGGTGASTASSARANLGVAAYLGAPVNQAAMLALTGNVGDWCLRSDINSVFVLAALPATILGNWTQPDPDLATKIHTATAKSTLADDDEFGIVDSGASNALKRIKWSDIRGVIWGVITYFFQNDAALPITVASTAITLTSQPGLNVLTGSTAHTWTLPPVAGNEGKVIRIKNRATQTLTISRAGTDQIYSTAANNSVTVAAGASLTLVCDGTYWVTN